MALNTSSALASSSRSRRFTFLGFVSVIIFPGDFTPSFDEANLLSRRTIQNKSARKTVAPTVHAVTMTAICLGVCTGPGDGVCAGTEGCSGVVSKVISGGGVKDTVGIWNGSSVCEDSGWV